MLYSYYLCYATSRRRVQNGTADAGLGGFIYCENVLRYTIINEELMGKIRTTPPCSAAALWRASVAICVAFSWASFSRGSGALSAFCRRLHELVGPTSSQKSLHQARGVFCKRRTRMDTTNLSIALGKPILQNYWSQTRLNGSIWTRDGDSPQRGGESPQRDGDSPQRGGNSPQRDGDSSQHAGAWSRLGHSKIQHSDAENYAAKI